MTDAMNAAKKPRGWAAYQPIDPKIVVQPVMRSLVTKASWKVWASLMDDDLLPSDGTNGRKRRDNGDWGIPLSGNFQKILLTP